MLSRNERKELAFKYGYKTIGEFEEYMTMQRAVGDSSDSQPYSNTLAYPPQPDDSHPLMVEAEQRKLEAAKNEEEESDHEELDEKIESERLAAQDTLPTDQLLQVGGRILILPDDLLHRVFDFLPVDTYATLALVSPHWKSFTRTEAAYRRLCERLYLQQSKKRTLHVSRFGNSYRTMLEKRPRVRAGGGVYVIKYKQIKKIQRDMWTEIPHGAILESIYYRYLYFQEDGRVIYALTTTAPHDMFPRLRRVNLGYTEDAAAVWGRYQVSGRQVTVIAKQPWQYVKIVLTIQPINIHGRNGFLSFEEHLTSSNDEFNEHHVGTVRFEVPSEPFRFVADHRL
ncbi:hypothetical protein FisN_8Lh308 [Fistulifera solaris]|uniref:F-box domain-containing protein n=1 Tax=Fistulifera solaris TaxID=1519565 RepID=A0A1Z5JNB8_FISSO|nr:hypothetical protein FisN_8Lh308 [Fistulifera solaris]|eukprot:GAX15396.1 hypothetical protein FisN_8Lh308 [Fistulifera solaris]